MGPTVSIVGSQDPQLLQTLRVLGLFAEPVEIRRSRGEASDRVEGSRRLHHRHPRPAGAAARTSAVLKRQFPASGIVIVAKSMDPTVMLEAMRQGVNEWLQRAADRGGDRRGDPPRGTAARERRRRERPSPSWAPRAASAARRSPSIWRPRCTRRRRQPTLVMDLHLTHGDASVYFGVEPRFSVLDALENIHRLDETYFKGLVTTTKAGPDLLASSDRALIGSVDVTRVRQLIEFASTVYRYVVLDCPRSDATLLEALDAASTVDHHREPGTGDAAERDSHRLGAPAAMRSASREAGAQPTGSWSRYLSTGCRARPRRAGEIHASRATIARRSRR